MTSAVNIHLLYDPSAKRIAYFEVDGVLVDALFRCAHMSLTDALIFAGNVAPEAYIPSTQTSRQLPFKAFLARFGATDANST